MMDLVFRIFATVCLLAAVISANLEGGFQAAFYLMIGYALFINIAWAIRRGWDNDRRA